MNTMNMLGIKVETFTLRLWNLLNTHYETSKHFLPRLGKSLNFSLLERGGGDCSAHRYVQWIHKLEVHVVKLQQQNHFCKLKLYLCLLNCDYCSDSTQKSFL